MNYLILLAIFISLFSGCFFMAPEAHATAYWDGFSELSGQAGQGLGLKYEEADRIIVRIIRWFLALIGVIAVAAIIFAGLRLVTSRGEEAAMADAKKILFWAIMGLVIAVLAWSIISILSNTLSI